MLLISPSVKQNLKNRTYAKPFGVPSGFFKNLASIAPKNSFTSSGSTEYGSSLTKRVLLSRSSEFPEDFFCMPSGFFIPARIVLTIRPFTVHFSRRASSANCFVVNSINLKKKKIILEAFIFQNALKFSCISKYRCISFPNEIHRIANFGSVSYRAPTTITYFSQVFLIRGVSYRL